MSKRIRSTEGNDPIRLGITMGDPGGIGPEVILKALQSLDDEPLEITIFGARQVLELEQRALLESGALKRAVLPRGEAHSFIAIDEVAPKIKWHHRPDGTSGPEGALVQRRALQAAMGAASSGAIDAIVTAPWNKELFTSIGEPVEGHTEVLARYFDADEVVMMLAGSRLRVALVTTHIGIDEVPEALTAEKIETTIRITAGALSTRFGIAGARIAVCGLNPHAGEGGHMGRQEIECITPVIEEIEHRWSGRDISVEGPFAADTLFAKFRHSSPYDAVVCMYHDQGLIPLKLLHFSESANITLGLPVVRTSVDHGTAYDIAGQGIADAGSMRFAMAMAVDMVRRGREKEKR